MSQRSREMLNADPAEDAAEIREEVDREIPDLVEIWDDETVRVNTSVGEVAESSTDNEAPTCESEEVSVEGSGGGGRYGMIENLSVPDRYIPAAYSVGTGGKAESSGLGFKSDEV